MNTLTEEEKQFIIQLLNTTQLSGNAADLSTILEMIARITAKLQSAQDEE